jgi:Peptidase propeptide and YPEB domain
MQSTVIVCLMILLAVGTTQTARADTPTYKRDVPAKLASEAKITEAAAISVAKREVSGGNVVALELEREKGMLLYSIDLKVPGADGINEVEVDAMDGRVIASGHESAAEEKEEAAKEKEDKEEKAEKDEEEEAPRQE